MNLFDPLLLKTRSIEPLEARIAPASIINIGAQGSSENPTDTEYKETGSRPAPYNVLSFVDTSTATDAISAAVDGNLGTENTFYLRLSAGDKVRYFTNVNNYQDLITVRAGKAIAFFTDANNNNEYDEGELTGLSLGASASIEVNGTVYGDIVTNLNERGTANPADDTVEMNGLVGPRQGIGSLSVIGGEIRGKVLTAGDIRALSAIGNVFGVYAGSAASGKTFDFFTVAAGEGTALYTPAPGQIGASITNFVARSITDSVEAGGGGVGAVGGSLSKIQITSDTDGFILKAGNGGDADFALKRPNGGTGGSVTSVIVSGISDPTPNSSQFIDIQAGDGGDGLNTGRGGAGGAVRDIRVGYEINGGRLQESAQLLSDAVGIRSGDGGVGLTGGAGGLVSTVKVRVITPDVNGNEIEIRSGSGGSSISPKGAAGIGGSINDLQIANRVVTAGGDMFIQAGNGGTTVGDARGAAGGSLTNFTLLGYNQTLIAGDGSDGKTGGRGGSIVNIVGEQNDEIFAQNLQFNAGHGGNASGGTAGDAGDISRITYTSADLEVLKFNNGISGDGGASIRGRGGRGSAISSISITDSSAPAAASAKIGTADIRAGNGGSGQLGGGNGGALTTLFLESIDMSLTVNSGNGGNATVRGNGGIGGAITGILINAIGIKASGATATDPDVSVTGALKAGNGGNGTGPGGIGGAGGTVNTAQLLVGRTSLNQTLTGGDASIIAGDGGSGQVAAVGVAGGAPGRGGSVLASSLRSEHGAGLIHAGDAGAAGTRAAAGGSILGVGNTTVVIRARTDITATAGDGTSGGAGGDIRSFGYQSPSTFLLPTPTGSILVQAGDGSQGSTVAGKGGAIDNVQGSVSSTAGETVNILGGKGGGDTKVANVGGFTYTGSGKSGAGGSVSNISLARGGADGVVIKIAAGDAGHGATASSGARGGDVRTIAVNDITDNTILRSISAGDGGDAKTVGGLGGTINDVRVQAHDIGIRTGQTFGIDKMGGLFAGAGGLATKRGLAGNVSNISADSIAAIVAGKTSAPEMVERADAITVNGSNLLLERNGAFRPHSPFVLSYEGQNSASIPGNATAQQVQTALNLVPKVAADGGVTVSYTADGGYSIIFGSTQEASTPSNLTALDLQNSLNSLPTVLAKGGVTVTPLVNSFQITFGATSASIAANANAAAISAALNSTGLSAFGTFTVNVKTNGDFLISYAATSNGDKSQITGVENIAVDISELVKGRTQALSSVEKTNGQFSLFVSENRSGSDSYDTIEAVRGDRALTATEITPGDTVTVSEVQQIDLNPLNSFPTGKFTLEFVGETTNPISGTGTSAAIATAIQAELNALTSVQTATNNLGVVVTPSAQFPRAFVVTFGGTEDQPAILGNYFLPETQRLSLGALGGVAGSTFTLTFNGQTTTPLSSLASAAQIEAALELLPDVVNPLIGGGVKVTLVSNGTFDITFADNPAGNGIGDQNAIAVQTFLPETQTLSLGNLPTFPTGTFRLTFDTANTTTGITTIDLPSNATAAQIQNALNALDSVKATGPGNTGAVVVTAIPTGGFQIAFNQPGEQPQIVGIAQVPELQTIDLSTVTAVDSGEFTLTLQSYQALSVTEATNAPQETQRLNLSGLAVGGSFTLAFGNDTTISIPAGSTDVEIENALNSLGSITAAGGVSVTDIGGGQFDIVFASDTDETQIVARTIVSLGTTARLPYNATPAAIKAALDAISANFVDTVTPGTTPGTFDILFKANGDKPLILASAILREQQKVDVLDLGNFILNYNNTLTGSLQPPPTVPDPDNIAPALQADLNAKAAAVDAALDALVPGGVSVKAASDTSFIVTFNSDGDQIALTGVQPETMAATTKRPGSSVVPEIQEIRYFEKDQIDSSQYRVANVIGSISDLNERAANVFRFVEVNNIPGFNLGDRPIDGIVLAKFFNATNRNFIPEAQFTAAGFFDNDNIL